MQLNQIQVRLKASVNEPEEKKIVFRIIIIFVEYRQLREVKNCLFKFCLTIVNEHNNDQIATEKNLKCFLDIYTTRVPVN